MIIYLFFIIFIILISIIIFNLNKYLSILKTVCKNLCRRTLKLNDSRFNGEANVLTTV